VEVANTHAQESPLIPLPTTAIFIVQQQWRQAKKKLELLLLEVEKHDSKNEPKKDLRATQTHQKHG
jgi:hypothetical protein